MDAYRCPGCHVYTGPAVTDGGPASCPVCRLPLDGPEIAELRYVDAELGAVEARRAVLHQRRAALVGRLRARQPAAPAGGAPRADTPPRSAQNVLLTLGGLLIVVAGLVFTLVSWGRFGIGGRGAVLTALTVLVLAAPLGLRRRGLDATAETASAVGLALVLLDAYAARAADVGGLLGADGAAYWAAVTAFCAAAAAAYARATRSRLVPYAALLLLQCPAPLTAASLHTHATGLAYALLAAAVANLAVSVAFRMPAAAGAAGVWTAAATLVAIPPAYTSPTCPSALRAAIPLALAAALSLAAARGPRLHAALAGRSTTTHGSPHRAAADSPHPAAAGGSPQPTAADGSPHRAAAGSSLHRAAAGSPHPAAGGSSPQPTAADGSPHRAAAGSPHPAAGGSSPQPTAADGSPQTTADSSTHRAAAGSPHPAAGGSSPQPTAAEGSPYQAAAGSSPHQAGAGGSSRPGGAGGGPYPGGAEGAAADRRRAGGGWGRGAAAGGLGGAAGVAALLGGLALIAACGVVPWVAMADGWRVVALVAPAAVVASVALAWLPAVPVVGPVRRARDPLWAGLFAAAATVLVLAGADVLPDLLRALVRMRSAGEVPAVAATLAAVLAGTAERFGRHRSPLRCAAVLAAMAAGVTVSPAAGRPYAASLAAAGVLALAAGAHCLRRPAADPAPQWCALLAPAGVALAWSLSHDAAALTVWAAAAALAACLAAAGRHAFPAAAFAVLALGYEAARAGGAAGLPPHLAAFAVLGVAVATVPVAARLGGRVALAVEWSGYAVGAVAVAATAGHPDALSAALGIAGAAGVGVAVRADRRAGGALGAGVLLAASSWVRLALAGVGAPEPYTVSMSVVLLGLGYLRRRRDPRLGSWAAYGSGLGFSLLPSLVAAWSGTQWLRPLLLGLTALAVTLLGARYRLRAPLVVGGAVLAADAVRELAPTVAESVGRLPHWVAVAAAGLLLLYVGATYERRLRTAQRLRRTFHSLR